MGMSAEKAAIEVQKLVNKSNTEGFKYNSAEAAKTRAWQREMSDTAHQREVVDLIHAGLNPVLSANNGAQSYTSSSAQYAAQNAASAVAGLYETEMSAKATKKAAKTSAAATKQAAAASAAATKYAADMNYASTVYQADKAEKIAKYQVDYGKSGTVAGIIDSWVKKYQLPSASENLLRTLWSKVTTIGNNLATNRAAGNSLSQMGIPNTKKNRKIMISAAKGNKKSISQINSLAKQYTKLKKFK